MTFSPFDHPVLGGLLGDTEIAGYFAAEAELRAMLIFEVALAAAGAVHGFVPETAARQIAITAENFAPDIDRLRTATSVDGVAVPELVRQLRETVGGTAAAHVHFGATSQDVIDTALMLRLKQVLPILDTRLSVVLRVLAQLDQRFGNQPLTAFTRMQPAIQISVADRLRAWREPAERTHVRLRGMIEAGLPVQFGGAAGTLEKYGDKGSVVRATLARALGLADRPQWHSQRDLLAEIAGILSLVTGAMGKFGQDVALMAQTGDEIELAGGGGSSVMPHKRNPVGAETLVTLARFNPTQLASMHHALVHEQERSGASWMLEWMLLPQMVCATAAALRIAAELAGNIRLLGPPAAE